MLKTKHLLVLCLPLLLAMQCDDDVAPFPIDETTVFDADGNEYATIQLGNQTWMLQNLKTTSYNDGTPINQYMFGDDWYNANNPIDYFQWADTSDLNDQYDEELPIDFFGAMYNEIALSSGKLAPVGWRIPTEQDFMELEAFLANDGNAGSEATALKSSTGWIPGNSGTDVYGFNGLPNGYVSAGGTATGAQAICSWATSNTNTANQTRRIVSLFEEPTIQYFDNSILLGAGVRCIKE
ncbi:MAG: fibrobacter succinogenes major paralogous domain-containing protein [Bacteroidia bacterium]|nr:fibrobacter succinogenes major paralogous domain-containing protein [Bacteroidia bacterium]